ncbi:uncharacterized, partial [Tachysurus ichikawai]
SGRGLWDAAGETETSWEERKDLTRGSDRRKKHFHAWKSHRRLD